MSQLGHRACLYLAHPFPRDTKVLADVLESPWMAIVEAEPHADNLLLTSVQLLESLHDRIAEHQSCGSIGWHLCIQVG